MLLGNPDRLPCGRLMWAGNTGNLLAGCDAQPQPSRIALQTVHKHSLRIVCKTALRASSDHRPQLQAVPFIHQRVPSPTRPALAADCKQLPASAVGHWAVG